MRAAKETVKVWDLVVRYFHWLLVVCFASAYLTREDYLSWHVFAGYVVGILLTLRIIWGFVGDGHARFTDFIYPPRRVASYLWLTLRGRAPRYLGHNPAGGAMILLLLLSLILTVLSGLLLYGIGDGAGPLAWVSVSPWLDEAAEGVHEFLVDFPLLLVLIHVAGVVFESVSHRENLVRAMWTGRKPQAVEASEVTRSSAGEIYPNMQVRRN